jgi:hypothetical protein
MIIEENRKDPFKSLPDSYKRVLSLIGVGSGNPTPVKYITSLTGLNDYTVREIVSDLVNSHRIKIGSSTKYGKHGFYMITNREEMDENVRVLMSRGTKLIQRAKALMDIPDRDQNSFDF